MSQHCPAHATFSPYCPSCIVLNRTPAKVDEPLPVELPEVEPVPESDSVTVATEK